MNMIEYHPKPNPRVFHLPPDRTKVAPEKCLLIVPYKSHGSELRRLNKSPAIQPAVTRRTDISSEFYSFESCISFYSTKKEKCTQSVLASSDGRGSSNVGSVGLRTPSPGKKVSWEKHFTDSEGLSEIIEPLDESKRIAVGSAKTVADEKPVNRRSFCLVEFFMFLPVVLFLLLFFCQWTLPIPISCLLQRNEITDKMASKSLLSNLTASIAGQDVLVEKMIKTLYQFSDAQNGKKLLIMSLKGDSGVGKTLVVEEILKGIHFRSECQFTNHDLEEPANFLNTIKSVGVSFTSIDAASSSVHKSVTHFLELIQDLQACPIFTWFGHYNLLYQKMVLVIESRSENIAEDQIFGALRRAADQQKLKNIQGDVELQFLNASRLSRSDVCKCVDIELRRYSQSESDNGLNRRRHSLEDYQRWVLDNIEFDESGFSLTGCKVVNKLISLI